MGQGTSPCPHTLCSICPKLGPFSVPGWVRSPALRHQHLSTLEHLTCVQQREKLSLCKETKGLLKVLSTVNEFKSVNQRSTV